VLAAKRDAEQGTSAHDIANLPLSTRTNEMTNRQARMKHRTTAQIAELCSQSAEDYHQQYLQKVPNGYCPDHSTGVSCPVGILPA
jgi:peptide methionine sulfoxide reductase MsrA